MSRTILLLTPTLLARADFSKRGSLVAAASGPPPPQVADLGSLTMAALGLIKAKPKRVSVLTTSAVTAIVETAVGRLDGLTEQERNTALAFEAEAMTGITAQSSQTSAQRMAAEPGTEQWWITQISQTERGQMASEIKRCGARLEAIAHPGGLATRLGEDCLERWHDLLLIHRQTATGAALDILPVDETASLGSLLERFPSDGGGRAVLTPTAAEAIPGVTLQILQREEDLRRWMIVWHEALSAPVPTAPILFSPPQPMGAVGRVWLSVGTGVAAVALCGGHWYLTKSQLLRATTELKEISGKVRDRGELDKISADVGRLKSELQITQQAQEQTLSGFGGLLKAVAELRPAGLVVRALKDPAGGNASSGAGKYAGMGVSVTGTCTHQELAGQFSEALGVRLAQMSWEVRPARTSARLVAGTAVWDFEIPMQLNTLTSAATQ